MKNKKMGRLTDEEIASLVYKDMDDDSDRPKTRVGTKSSEVIVVDDVNFRPVFKYRVIDYDVFKDSISTEFGVDIGSDEEESTALSVFNSSRDYMKLTDLVNSYHEYINGDK